MKSFFNLVFAVIIIFAAYLLLKYMYMRYEDINQKIKNQQIEEKEAAEKVPVEPQSEVTRVIRVPCPICNGEGRVDTNSNDGKRRSMGGSMCPNCKGTGYILSKESVSSGTQSAASPFGKKSY